MTTLAHRTHRRTGFAPMAWIERAYGTWRQRCALARLDDRRLRDVGLTEAEAWAEANRPFWDLPR
jgi:uncharacterized protein YjiS (DUF1127 family)